MAAPISDAVIVDVFRRVDRLLTPLVARLGRPPSMSQHERDQWWADRITRFAAGVAAAPRLAGKFADLLPLHNVVGTVVQSVIVLGVAGERGMADPAERVSLLARVLTNRDLPPARVRPMLTPAKGTYRDDAFGTRESRTGVRGTARTLWRVARLLSRIDDALDERPKGKLRHRTLSNLPFIGVFGGYAAEREGERRAAARAAAELSAPVSG
jgi:hypothetical protein